MSVEQRPGHGDRDEPERQRHEQDYGPGEPEKRDLPHDPSGDQAADERSGAEAREAETDDLRIRVVAPLRSDVSLEDVAAFINVVANGMALATSLGLQLDPEAVLQLIHHGIDAK